MSAFLFLRTASIGVVNMQEVVRSTKNCVLYAVVNDDYKLHMQLEKSLEKEQQEVEKWKGRLVEAQIGFVDGLARQILLEPLPIDILLMIRDVLAG